MSDSMTTKSDEAACDINSEDTALFKTLSRLLGPLARLCLANGITFATVEEVLKRAFVQEANSLQPGAPEHGMVSRVSTATGINRREVTRLTTLKAPERATKQPLASEILARWTTDHSYRNQNGDPSKINRLGPAPSFEALAQTVTRDVHPRSMLDELIRLELVSHDKNLDQVSLTRPDFVPRCDSSQMLNFLGDNVGDHLNAAIANVLHDGNSHLEQAVFADELSAESLETIRPLVLAHWKALREDLVPAITTLIEADKLAGRAQDQRVRIGLYSFTETTTDSKTAQKSRVARRFRKPASKENPK
ncbi:MAG: hypothetical protein JJE30_12480 [Desulfuromonadales bacterium]|nr:hypothetical protein [Desulfuromonadales bacterium]